MSALVQVDEVIYKKESIVIGKIVRVQDPVEKMNYEIYIEKQCVFLTQASHLPTAPPESLSRIFGASVYALPLSDLEIIKNTVADLHLKSNR